MANTGHRANIVITPREGFSRSIESLDSVLQSLSDPSGIVYVDAGSPLSIQRDIADRARTFGFPLLRFDEYLAPNDAKNRAIEFLDARFTAFLDNDVFVESGWLEAMIDCALETQAAVVAPIYMERIGRMERLHMSGGLCRICQEGSHRTLQVTHSDRQSEGPVLTGRRRTEHIEMHGFMVKTEWLQRCTLFDSEIPTIPENADFCLQVLTMGGEIYLEPRARLTVLLPDRIPEEDRDFFLLRWSEEWIEQGFSRMCSKWGLSGRQRVLESQRRWARAHRMIAYDSAMHQRIGILADTVLNRRVFGPLQHYLFDW